MRFALTGDSGMLGLVLDAVLREWGHERVEPDPERGVPPWRSPSTGLREPDFRAPEYLAWLAAAPVDVVIHCGALVGTPRCEAERDRVFSCNVSGPLGIADVVARRPTVRLVHLATAAEFDPDSYGRTNPLRVADAVADPRTLYGFSKAAGRIAVERAVPPDRLLVVWPSFGFGGRRDASSCVAELMKCAAGVYERRPFLPLDPEKVKEVTPHSFIARLIARAVELNLSGRVSASAGPATWIPYGEVVRLVAAVTGVRLEPDWHPDLDYKGDLVNDPDEVLLLHDLCGVRFDEAALHDALAAEWRDVEACVGEPGVARHEWAGSEVMRRRSC